MALAHPMPFANPSSLASSVLASLVKYLYSVFYKTGFTGDGKTCDDINECNDGTAVCDPNASCNNVPGSYTCTCKEGKIVLFFGIPTVQDTPVMVRPARLEITVPPLFLNMAAAPQTLLANPPFLASSVLASQVNSLFS
jgi:hypothetical protein